MDEKALHWVPAKRGLYLMDKPPPGPRAYIAGLPRTCRRRRPELLHATLLSFFDLAECPEEFLPELLKRMDRFRAYAFHMYFDNIKENGAVILCSSKPLHAANFFRKQLANYLIQSGFSHFAIPGRVHVTIKYGKDGGGDEPIEPISWRVDEILLIESLGGKSTHIERGRWPLSPLLI